MNYPEPKRVIIDSFCVVGCSVRTINSDEFVVDKAKLPSLWERFHALGIADKAPHRVPESPVFGVYSHYASDASDFYTVTAGVRVSKEEKDAGLQYVTIEKGTYLIFADKGSFPEIIINTWGRIWEFFTQNPHYQRSFRTDFELYMTTEEIAIYIGIQ